MSWPLVKLGKLCTVVRGSSPRPKGDPKYYGGNVPRLMVSDVTRDGKYVTPKIDFLTEAGAEKSRPMNKDDFIIAVSGQPGQALILAVDACIHDGFAGLRNLNESEISKDYLFHFMNSTKERFSASAAGAIFKNLTTEQIRELEIPLPPLDEQKRIAAILDKADAIRRKRQQAIQLADDFLRSVFLDMFGDPVTNPKGYPLSILSDFYISPKGGTKCGPFGSALKKHEYVEDGVPVWNMDNISLNGKFTDSPRLWITKSKYFDLEAYSVENGDVIISRAGTVGKMGVVRSKSEHSIISTNLIRVRFGEKLRPEYFVNLMNYCKGRVGRLKTGPDGAFTHMNTGILDKLEFPYPDIELQDKFIEIKEKVISSLEKSEKKDIDNLFNSLSQKAFAGEL